MSYRASFPFCFSLLYSTALAQNPTQLIINGSFENYSNCPIAINTSFYTNNWHAIGTVDYYNSCNNIPSGNGDVGVPSNAVNSSANEGLNAVNGSAYCGIISSEANSDASGNITSTVNYREILYTSVVLDGGVTYQISFNVSLASNSRYSTDLALVVSQTLPEAGSLFNYGANEFFGTEGVVDNIGSWETVSFEYSPLNSGTYYLAIGNFHNSEQTTFQFASGGCLNCTDYAYYYIDEVSLTAEGCCPENLTITSFEITEGAVEFAATNTITIGNDVHFGPNSQVHVIAGERIEINPGFISDGNFVAEIGACPANTQLLNMELLNSTITPNDDGIGDEICAFIAGGTGYEITVTNVIGQLIFETSGVVDAIPTCIWEGGSNPSGAIVSDGFYLIEVIIDGCEGVNEADTFNFTVLASSSLGRYGQNEIGELAGRDSEPFHVSNPSSIENQSPVTLYPNPTTGLLTLTHSQQLLTVDVYDPLGRQLLRTAPNTTATSIDLSGQPAGIYIIRAGLEDGTVETHRVVLSPP